MASTLAGVELRRAQPGDELAVATVHVRSWQRAYRGIVPDDYLESMRPEERAARYTFSANDPDHPVTLIAVDGGKVLGFATFGEAPNGADAGAARLFALYADPDQWNRGVGVALISEARSRLTSSGFAEAVLWVLEENARGRRFYERDGWVLDGATDGFEIDGKAIPEVRMRRRLDVAQGVSP